MNRSLVQSALRETRAHLTNPKALGAMAVVGILLGLAGPFGTFEIMPPLPRTAYWLASVAFTYGFGYAISMLADAAWGQGRPIWQRFALMVLPSGLGATAIMVVLNFISFGVEGFGWTDLPALLAECFAVAAGVVTLLILGDRAPDPAASPTAVPPPVLERVPPGQRGRLLALSVADHYVDVITDRGKALVLMRLGDAIRETGSVPGLQIHRSHWVAREAVIGAHRSDGKVTLELSNGLRLPVSRGYLQTVREAGLL